jgi:hypothetical protein
VALSPTQKKLLMYGVPAVAALGLFVYLQSRNSSAATTATASGTTTASDTAVGLGQLASFENAVQGQIAQLSATVNSLGPAAAGTGSTSGTTTAAPAPVATPTNPSPSGYQYISSPSQSKVLAAAGYTQYGDVGGQLVPVLIGTKPTAAFAPYEAANNNTGKLYITG